MRRGDLDVHDDQARIVLYRSFLSCVRHLAAVKWGRESQAPSKDQGSCRSSQHGMRG
jgi:hypothetical protein